MQVYARRRAMRLSGCQQCLSLRASRAWALPTVLTRPSTKTLTMTMTPTRHVSTTAHKDPPNDPKTTNAKRSVRDQLRASIRLAGVQPVRPMPRDFAPPGATQNAMTRLETDSMAQIETLDGLNAGGLGASGDKVHLWEEVDAGADAGDGAQFFARPYGTATPQAGDLIEVTTDSWRIQLLAVCLGRFRGVDHYYTSTGKWFAATTPRTLFHVTKFATAEEMAPVIAALPSLATHTEAESAAREGRVAGAEPSARDLDRMLNTLQDMRLGPGRDAGAALLHKMHTFQTQATNVHMAYAGLLDNAYSIVRKAVFRTETDTETSWAKPFTQDELDAMHAKAYYTVEELAAIVFRHKQGIYAGPQTARMNPARIFPLRNFFDPASNTVGQDEYTAPALYAIYRALVNDDVAFRPVSSKLANPNETDDQLMAETLAEYEKQADDEGGPSQSVDYAELQQTYEKRAKLSRARSCLFSITRPEDVDMVNEVEQAVREYVTEDSTDSNRMTVFIENARSAIDHNRRSWRWTPYGMLLPVDSGYTAEEKAYLSAPVRLRRKKRRGRLIGRQLMRNRLDDRNKMPSEPQRPWTNAIVNGPMRAVRAMQPIPTVWRPDDMVVLHFIHLWAGYQRFSPSSRLHWIGSTILRATQRYGDAEYLTASTGWTFLQECNYLKPWDLPARYSMSLPDVPPDRAGGLRRDLYLLPSPSPSPALIGPDDRFAPDIFEGHREPVLQTVYCIDAPDAEDVDDGVSIEVFTNGDVWVHVHVADPGSQIRPGSRLAEQAAQMSQTAYIPGYEEPMFPDDEVRRRFSLKPGAPCLTISAKYSKRGTLKAIRIVPGVLRGRVINLSPEQLSDLAHAEETRAGSDFHVPPPASPTSLQLPWQTASFAVGVPLQPDGKRYEHARLRFMTTDDVPMAVARDLKQLTRFATILRGKRLAEGAMPLYWPRPNVAVSTAFTASRTTRQAEDLFQCQGAPHIKIYYDGYDDSKHNTDMKLLALKGAARASGCGPRIVESLMRMAGEVVAQWCADRGIAIPFRGHPDAAAHIDTIKSMARDKIYPLLLDGRRPNDDALLQFRQLLGADEITAVPVPHITMGAACYTKATSPLRRYADLVVHWQIEHYLRAELNAAAKAKSTTGPHKLPLDRPRRVGKGLAIALARDPLANRNRDPEALARDMEICGPAFSRAEMERDVLPLLRVRERQMRALGNRAGRDHWMLQALLRAWQGGERPEVYQRVIYGPSRAELRRARKTIVQVERRYRRAVGIRSKKIETPYMPLPRLYCGFRNMRFTVTGVMPHLGRLVGRLDWFERVAVLELAALNRDPANPPANELLPVDKTPPLGLTKKQKFEYLKKRHYEYDDDDVNTVPDPLSMQRLAIDDVQVGQVFPVALLHVDVAANRVFVRRTGNACPPGTTGLRVPVPQTRVRNPHKKKVRAVKPDAPKRLNDYLTVLPPGWDELDANKAGGAASANSKTASDKGNYIEDEDDDDEDDDDSDDDDDDDFDYDDDDDERK